MRAALLTLALVALALPADADDCATWTTTTHGHAGTPVVEADGRYLLVECYIYGVNGCSFWGYRVSLLEESNGIPGLQHADEIHDDTCHGMIPGDRVVL